MLFQNRPHETSWKPTALVIDNDADIHREIHVMLGKDYDVHHAYFPRLAVSLLEKRHFNVVFSSLKMGSAEEMPELHRTIEALSKDKGIPLIFIGDDNNAAANPSRYVDKPLRIDRLLAALDTTMRAYSNADERQQVS